MLFVLLAFILGCFIGVLLTSVVSASKIKKIDSSGNTETIN